MTPPSLGLLLFPPHHYGNLCGQADIVIEYSSSISFPLLRGNQSRLYLAETVCCVIEVKSDLSAQWPEAVEKGKRLAKLRRDSGWVVCIGDPPPNDIPIFAVGYTGWTTEKTCKKKLTEAGLSGLLVTVALAEATVVSKSICVKYGPCPLDVSTFTCTDTLQSSFVRRVCYDEPKSFMVIKLKETWYHY